jgi:hypothetical protein
MYDKQKERLMAVLNNYGVRIRTKSSSLLMRLLSVLLFFNKNFSKHYTTTIGRTIYFPDDFTTDGYVFVSVTAHEAVHITDYINNPAKFIHMYLSPQIYAVFSLFALGSFWSPYFLCFLAFLIFLYPWASEGRTLLELRAYAITMAVNHWMKGHDLGDSPEWYKKNYPSIVAQFTGWSYYRMCQDEFLVTNMLAHYGRKIKHGLIHEDIPIATSIRRAISR